MKVKLKPLNEQTIVITGASSGIGLTTARLAANQGANVVLAARNEEALKKATDDITAGGGRAAYVVADVGNEEDVRRIAQAAIDRFGGFDTWVNNSAASVYGRIEQVDLNDARRLFDTNFWGMVQGSRVALETLKQRGGALINIGSVVSDRAVPLQGFYSASKHAVKGFTDSLRMEVEMEGAPVSVTLIKPGPIDTPYTEHAVDLMENEPKHPPVPYAPNVVARTILHCATHPVRDTYVGGSGKLMAAMGQWAPRLTDYWMERNMREEDQQLPVPNRHEDGLNKPGHGGSERGPYMDHVAESSLYTAASLHPILTATAVAAAVGVTVAAVLGAKAAAAAPPRSRWDRVKESVGVA